MHERHAEDAEQPVHPPRYQGKVEDQASIHVQREQGNAPNNTQRSRKCADARPQGRQVDDSVSHGDGLGNHRLSA